MIAYVTREGARLDISTADTTALAFFRRVERAAADPSVTEEALIELVWGEENPLLGRSAAGRPALTLEGSRHPAWQAMQDLLVRKRHARR